MSMRSAARGLRSRPSWALLAAAATLLAGSAVAQGFAIDCDVVAGIPTLRLSAPAGVRLRSQALDEQTWLLEVDVPRLPGLPVGSRSCVAATSLRIVPGELLATRSSRILIRHDGRPPRSFVGPGRVRLTWLPQGLPAAPPARRIAGAFSDAAIAPERVQPEPMLREEPMPPAASEPEPLPRAAREPEPVEGRVAVTPVPPEPERREPAPPVAPPSPPSRQGLAADYAPFDAPATLVVSIPTDLRAGPGRRHESLRPLAAGERIRVSGRAGDWYRAAGEEGWIFATYLEPPGGGGSAVSLLGVVRDVTVPVHEGPGGQHAVVAELYRGQQVVIDELKGEWAHVRNGGWVSRTALGDMTPGQESR